MLAYSNYWMWVEEKTNEKIQDILNNIPDAAVMYLINAIYCYGKWKHAFNVNLTQQGNFNLENGTSETVDFMAIENDFKIYNDEDLTAIELLYGNEKYSMVVILTEVNSTVQTVINKLTHGLWTKINEEFSQQSSKLRIPKLKLDYKNCLNIPLMNIGMGIAFSDAADFSSINSGGGLYISRVIYQSFIKINEIGTEAAAATIVEIVETSNPPNFKNINIDRPFIIAIQEREINSIVFLGRIMQPVWQY